MTARSSACFIIGSNKNIGAAESFPCRACSIFCQSVHMRAAVDLVGWRYLLALYRNVTICPRVQVLSGEKVVAEVPEVMPFSTAQLTAWA